MIRAVLLGIAAGLVLASPAAAHPASGSSVSDYRTTVTSITPAGRGITVRPVEAGASLELRSPSATVEILGYSGEPYLRAGPGGAYLNTSSPAGYLNTGKPSGGDPALPPTWQKLTATSSVRWHDHRAHWMGQPPPITRTEPGRTHRLRDWTIPIRLADGATGQVTGTLDWVPPPQQGLWWAGILLGGCAVAFASRYLRLAAAIAGATGLVALADTAGRYTDAETLHSGQLWAAAAALGMLAAAGYAALGKPAANFALGLAGAALAALAGLTQITVLTHAIAPVPWDGALARLATALSLAAGTGLAAGALLHRPGPARQDMSHGGDIVTT
ncbi:hypothetical protein [Longispora albida]|uniref:hypothetical protein n=1 Tax=Longispora albida TaxID=203523 RepID=UPI00037A1006|nr:hypothetical protein [Longispora albida]